MKLFSTMIFSLFILIGSAHDDYTMDYTEEQISRMESILKGLEWKRKEVPPRLPSIEEWNDELLKDGILKRRGWNKVPSIKKYQESLKEQCLRYGTDESYDTAMAALDELRSCITGLVPRYDEIQREIEKAKPTGDLDIVFQKYCSKAPMLRNCYTKFLESVEPCMSPSERMTKLMVINVTDALTNFVCSKEGDLIPLFFEEGGPNCVLSTLEEIQQCIIPTISKYFPKDVPDKEDGLPTFKLGPAECQDVESLQKCVVSHLKNCPQPTPAKLIDRIFTIIIKVTPCQEYIDKARESSATSAL